METEIEITVECEGKYHRGSQPYFDQAFGNWLPGDIEEVSDFRVYLTRFSKKEDGKEHYQRLDITEWISEKEHDNLYNKFLESSREDG